MANGEQRSKNGEKTIVRDISWCGVFNGANACMVDVKDGKMLRIRPARYYEQYTKEEVKPWVMHARGKTFEPSEKSLVPPLSLAYKKRVYSPARIRYPMKRVDFDPKGERNPQNRGVSKYERISWDEALDIITSEMLRIKETYGPTAILYQSDQHGENKVVHGPARLRAQAAQPLRRLHPAGPRPRQLGGLVLGRQARVGLRAGGPADAAEEPPLRHLQERRAPALLGLRPGDHRLGLAGPAHQPPELLVDRAGHQADLHRSRRATTPTPSTPTSGSRSCPTPTPPSIWPSPTSGSRTAPTTRSTSRPTPTAWTSSRTTSWAGRTAMPKTPGVGLAHHRRPCPHHQGPGRGVGLQAHHHRHRQRRPRHPRPLRHRAGPPAGALPGHAGAGQAGLQPVQDDRVGAARRLRAGCRRRRRRS